MNIKKAATDHPILQVLAERWSPYGFEDRPVAEGDLCSLFEAARWAASSYNEQPWNYLVATRENPRSSDDSSPVSWKQTRRGPRPPRCWFWAS
jgi:nitroreductase